jgi:hypothetical protein
VTAYEAVKTDGFLTTQFSGVVKSEKASPLNVPHKPRTSSRYMLLACSKTRSPSKASAKLSFGKLN